MLHNDWGKFINTVLISAICLSFARCQALQGNLGPGVKFGDFLAKFLHLLQFYI